MLVARARTPNAVSGSWQSSCRGDAGRGRRKGAGLRAWSQGRVRITV